MKTILLAISFLCAWQAQAGDAKSWDRKAAAAYLDERMNWWATWPSAARDHETFCVSCHTTLPYALARPALRSALAEHAPSADERVFIDNISKRVSLWQEVQPFYSDAKNGAPKSAESRGTEAVLNALVLARYDAPAAIDALEQHVGAAIEGRRKARLVDLVEFPQRAVGSRRFGVLGRLAGGSRGRMGARKLSEQRRDSGESGAPRRVPAREQQTQSTLNRAVALWAAGKLPQLLQPEQRAAIVERSPASSARTAGGANRRW
jgi:hypothetical protein